MSIIFADDYLDKLKAGDTLIFAGNPDDDFFTHKVEYEVKQDGIGLYVIDDDGDEEEISKVSGQYFIVKENNVELAALREISQEVEKAVVACENHQTWSMEGMKRFLAAYKALGV